MDKPMTTKEAIEAVKKNLPPENYTMLRQALSHLISIAERVDEERINKILYDTKITYDNLSDCGKVSLPLAGSKVYVHAIVNYLEGRG